MEKRLVFTIEFAWLIWLVYHLAPGPLAQLVRARDS